MGVLYPYYVWTLLAHPGNDSDQRTVSPAVSKVARSLGRIQGASVLLLVAPSGLWMAFYAETGAIAGAGFASLAVATGMCVALGWRSAMKQRFAEHQHWMLRCFVLLCSAVVLRLIGGATTVAGVDAAWVYPLAAWTCWLVPLMAYEWIRCLRR